MTNKKSLMEIHLTSVDVFLACSQQLAQPVHRRRVAIDNGKLLFKHPPPHTHWVTGLASFCLDFQSALIPVLGIFVGPAKNIPIPSDTIPQGLL